jgi:AcrR family transcriptional regulator
LAAAADTLRFGGIAALSARTIAARAEVNQALVFYHFGTVTGLVDAAVRESVDRSVAVYRAQFAEVTSLTQLLRVGRQLHERERAAGNVAMMAQLMSGAQRDPVLAAAAGYAMRAWTTELEAVVRRLMRGSPLAGIVEPAGLARAISAGFLGLELYDGVDAVGAGSALDAIERLGVLVEVVDDLGPVARRAVRSRMRRAGSSGP